MVKISIKLIILCILLSVIPALLIGGIAYKNIQATVKEGIQDRLKSESNDWRIITNSYQEEVKLQEKNALQSANDIVDAQAKMTYELIDKALKDNNGALPEATKQDILNRISKNKVGKTGYVWIIDYKGNYVLSKDRVRDGENVWNVTDANGNYVIQNLMRTGRTGVGNQITHLSYPWLNKGEIIPREKIAAMVHFPELGWVVGISTYYDDLVDMNFKNSSIEHVKNLMAAQKIGKTGYIWVVDENGVYVVSKDRSRDGEDISQAKDADGVFFIQKAMEKAKAAGNNADVQEYPWINKNKNETVPRMKLAGVTYVKELGWTIGVSAYYDDFDIGQKVLNEVIIIVLIVMIISGFLAYMFAMNLTKPIRKLTEAGNKIADGDIETTIPEIKSEDEIQELSVTMTLLAGALKFLKTENKKKQTEYKHKKSDKEKK